MNVAGKKNMVFFGCSFTAGHELADHEILGVTFEECNKMKEKHLRSGKTSSDFDLMLKMKTGLTHQQYVDISSKKTYASKLATKLGLSHTNYAEPGLSVEHSTLKLFDAFYAGKLNPDTDIIFFGLTTPHRYLYFNEMGHALTRVMSHELFFEEDIIHNDYKIMHSYYFAVQNFMNFCIKHSFEFTLQPSVNWKMLYPDIVNPQYELYHKLDKNWQYLSMYKKMLDEFLEHTIDKHVWLSSCYDRTIHERCGFNHPPEIAHDIYSEALYVKIINRQN